MGTFYNNGQIIGSTFIGTGNLQKGTLDLGTFYDGLYFLIIKGQPYSGADVVSYFINIVINGRVNAISSSKCNANDTYSSVVAIGLFHGKASGTTIAVEHSGLTVQGIYNNYHLIRLA